MSPLLFWTIRRYATLSHSRQCFLLPLPCSRCSGLILFPSGQVSLSWYTSRCFGGYSGEFVWNGGTVGIFFLGLFRYFGVGFRGHSLRHDAASLIYTAT